MKDEEGQGPAGPPRRQPDRLDAWFCWIAGLAAAALIGFCLFQALQTKPTDKTSAAHYHPHVIG